MRIDSEATASSLSVVNSPSIPRLAVGDTGGRDGLHRLKPLALTLKTSVVGTAQ